MKRLSRRGQGLAASFVVVLAAPACKKTPLGTGDPDPPQGPDHAYVHRQPNGECTMGVSPHCPKGVSCNPPAPEPIDCPPEQRDASDAPAVTRRPPGKADWLRVKPRLWGWNGKCSYTPERFCAPTSKPHECTPYPDAVAVTCAPVGDAGTTFTTEPFVWKDILGACHRVPALTCQQGQCVVPEGEPVACP